MRVQGALLLIAMAAMMVFGTSAGQSLDSSECKNIVCPQPIILKCPTDSELQLTGPINPLITVNQIEESSTIKDDHTINKRETDEKNLDLAAQAKRSLPEHDDINITLDSSTPHPEANEINGNFLVYESNRSLIEACCPPQPKCVCKNTVCAKPNCESGYVSIVMNQPVGVPGNCCPIFQCGLAPNCTELGNGYSWKENCKTCNCFDNQSLCIDDTTCLTDHRQDGERNTFDHADFSLKECYSLTLRRPFNNGQSWTEDECTECECKHGVSSCHTAMCKPVMCDNPVKLPGECCPKCDSFCDNHQHCDKSCKNGFKTDPVLGCNFCECAPAPPTTTTTTPSPVAVTTTTISVAELVPSSSSISTMHINIINTNVNTNQHSSNGTTNQSNCATATYDDRDRDGIDFTWKEIGIMMFIFALSFLIGSAVTYFFMKNKKTYKTVPTHDINANANKLVYTTA